MFHRFQDVMHELKNKHPLELKALLKETEPHRNFIKPLDRDWETFMPPLIA